MELQPVAQLIRDQTSMVKPEDLPPPAFKARQRLIVVWGLIMMFGGVAIGAGLKILARDNIHPAGELTPYLSVIGLLTSLVGMGWLCYPFLQIIPGKPRSQKPAVRTAGNTNKIGRSLPPEPFSVTDQTTELLEVSEARIEARDTTPQDE